MLLSESCAWHSFFRMFFSKKYQWENSLKCVYKMEWNKCTKTVKKSIMKGFKKGIKKVEVVYSRIFCFCRLKMMIKKAQSSKCARLDDVFDLWISFWLASVKQFLWQHLWMYTFSDWTELKPHGPTATAVNDKKRIYTIFFNILIFFLIYFVVLFALWLRFFPQKYFASFFL